MKKIYINNLNLFKSMKSKSALKNILKFSLGIGLLIPFFRNEPAKAFLTPCADSGTVADLSGEANPCFLTPETLKVTFYEIGFCTTDPLATGTFVNTTCQKSWDNNSGFMTDIGMKSFEKMNGTTYRVNNATYTYAYELDWEVFVLH